MPGAATRIDLERGRPLVVERAAGREERPRALQLGHALAHRILDRDAQLDAFDDLSEIVVFQRGDSGDRATGELGAGGGNDRSGRVRKSSTGREVGGSGGRTAGPGLEHPASGEPGSVLAEGQRKVRVFPPGQEKTARVGSGRGSTRVGGKGPGDPGAEGGSRPGVLWTHAHVGLRGLARPTAALDRTQGDLKTEVVGISQARAGATAALATFFLTRRKGALRHTDPR